MRHFFSQMERRVFATYCAKIVGFNFLMLIERGRLRVQLKVEYSYTRFSFFNFGVVHLKIYAVFEYNNLLNNHDFISSIICCTMLSILIKLRVRCAIARFKKRVIQNWFKIILRKSRKWPIGITVNSSITRLRCT